MGASSESTSKPHRRMTARLHAHDHIITCANPFKNKNLNPHIMCSSLELHIIRTTNRYSKIQNFPSRLPKTPCLLQPTQPPQTMYRTYPRYLMTSMESRSFVCSCARMPWFSTCEQSQRLAKVDKAQPWMLDKNQHHPTVFYKTTYRTTLQFQIISAVAFIKDKGMLMRDNNRS